MGYIVNKQKDGPPDKTILNDEACHLWNVKIHNIGRVNIVTTYSNVIANSNPIKMNEVNFQIRGFFIQ